MSTDEHPFLICRRADFPGLRRRARRKPWASMRSDALARVEAGLPDGEAPVPLQFYLGACSLAYIVDAEHAAAHAQEVRRAIVEGLSRIEFNPEKEHTGSVPPMGAAFVAILALDIVCEDLGADEIAACETVIEQQIHKIDRQGAWPAARMGTHGTWDVYQGRRTTPDDAFYEKYLGQMTPDGVTSVAPMYAFARLGSGNDRPQKTAYADVLEFTGIDRRYYNNPKLKVFYRWLFSSSVTPAKTYHLFGDTNPYSKPPNSPMIWRVGRFDREAAAYAAWLLEDKAPPGHILSYVLMKEPLPEPKIPQSRLFMQGEAVFREPEDSAAGLGSALYNITENDEFHTHEEVNAVSLAAYGNRLLVNGGWLGDDMRPPWRNNTLAIDGRRHCQRTGAGLAEGLLADGFHYACGDAGCALGDVSFQRSLVQIDGGDAAPGYFVLFDEIGAASGARVQSYLQPACETEVEELLPRRAYLAPIDHHAEVEGVTMLVYYATEPEAVERDRVDSGFLVRTPKSGRHVRLEASYKVDAEGNARIATIAIPREGGAFDTMPTQISQPGLSGALIDFGNDTRDMLGIADGETNHELDGRHFRAKAVVARRRAGVNLFYFTRHGRMFRDGETGFESDKPVSLFMRGTCGEVAGGGARLTLRYPGIAAVRLNGESVDAETAGENALSILLPAGRQAVTLVPTCAINL